jgi:hypothetical protein
MNELDLQRIVLALLLAGCTTDEGATRPVQSAHDPPPPAIVTPRRPADGRDGPSVGAASASPAPAAAEPKDPMLASDAPPIDCGQPLPNPHGFENAWPSIVAARLPPRDGSCKPCEQAPPKLIQCTRGERAAVIRSKDLSAHHGKLVRLEGNVAFHEVMCTKRGGRCACNNRCGAQLVLTRHVDKALAIDLSSQGEPMGCGGDEASICCPFELDRKTRSVAVIASGVWLDPLQTPPHDNFAPGQPRLEVEKLCRLK